jgi:hypothetical protein
MIHEWWWIWKGFGRNQSWSNLRCYFGIRLEGLRKDMKILSKDNRYAGRDLNPGAPGSKVGVLTIRPRRSVKWALFILRVKEKGKQSRNTPWWRLEKRRYSSYSFLTSALDGDEWSASRPDRALPRGKGPPVPIVQEAGWAPDTEVRGKIIFPCRGSNPGRPVHSQALYWLSYPAPYYGDIYDSAYRQVKVCVRWLIYWHHPILKTYYYHITENIKHVSGYTHRCYLLTANSTENIL